MRNSATRMRATTVSSTGVIIIDPWQVRLYNALSLQVFISNQRDCLFWTSHHAESTRLTKIRMWRIGGEPAVRPALQLSQERETREIFIVDLSDFKNIIGTDLHAITFSLAGIAIYHGPISAGFPGFPVELVGAGEVHAAFLNESRTRGSFQGSVQQIRGAKTHPALGHLRQ